MTNKIRVGLALLVIASFSKYVEADINILAGLDGSGIVDLYDWNGNLLDAFTVWGNFVDIEVPEPATILLLGLGGLAFRRRSGRILRR
jgi:hypothetical protein